MENEGQKINPVRRERPPKVWRHQRRRERPAPVCNPIEEATQLFAGMKVAVDCDEKRSNFNNGRNRADWKNHDNDQKDRIKPPANSKRKWKAPKNRCKEVENDKKHDTFELISKTDLDAFFANSRFQKEFSFYENLEQLKPLRYAILYLDHGHRYLTTEVTLEGFYSDGENEYSYDLGPETTRVKT